MVRDNASAYGFSVAITGAFGVVSGTHGTPSPLNVVLFSLGSAVAFFLVEAGVSHRFRRGVTVDPGNVILVSSAVNMLSITAAVACGIGLAFVPSVAAWPLTSLGTTAVYLLAGGFDLLVARFLVRKGHTARSD